MEDALALEPSPWARWVIRAMFILLVLNVGFSLTEGLPQTTRDLFITPLLGVLFCLASAIYLTGWRVTFSSFFLVVALSWGVEQLGVTTGFPFGNYRYNAVLGPKLGEVPYVIPLYWFMILYVGLILANLTAVGRPISGRTRLWQAVLLALLGGLIAGNYDLSLDPYMVYGAGAWTWFRPNGTPMTLAEGFFGVPPKNFYGWVLTAFVLGLLVRLLHQTLGVRTMGNLTKFSALAPIIFYLSWWWSHAQSGFPPTIRAMSMISLGIPALAAFFCWLRWEGFKDLPKLSGGTAPGSPGT